MASGVVASIFSGKVSKMTSSNELNHHGAIAIAITTLTNPGIIDRLEQDITDYLSPFGFRLERQRQLKDGAVDNSRGGSTSTATALLAIPCLPYSYAPGNETSVDNDNDFGMDGEIITVGPIGTLHLHIHQESLLPTVGPLLRTFLRLSPHHISPLKLRAVIHCEFTLDALEKIDKMNAEQRRNQLNKQEELSARRMAHHVHMLVRNSMGSALCLELVANLPCYWRRKLESNSVKSVTTKSKVPISVDSVSSAMRDNPDACYPSVQLVQQGPNCDNGDESESIISGSRSIHLDVNTRMCTVRHQPLIFRWLHSLQYPMENNIDDGLSKESMNSSSSQHATTYPEHPESIFKSMPLIVACIEKVGNLHRILMLCHDYDKIHQSESNGSSAEEEDDDRQSLGSTLLSHVIVIIPNEPIEEEERKNGKPGRGNTLSEFENAIDHFHEVIIDPDKSNGHNHNQKCRPTFVCEEHAAEEISKIIKQRQLNSTQGKPPSGISGPSVVGIDLHPDALTLNGDYAIPDQTISLALSAMRNADAIVFGYESTGIPEQISNELNSWVQIPSRSSINVVAAMSIVLDALLGAGAEVGIAPTSH